MGTFVGLAHMIFPLTSFIKAIQEDYLDFEELEFDESDEEEEKIFTMKGRGNVH
jgi:hypothetical protein